MSALLLSSTGALNWNNIESKYGDVLVDETLTTTPLTIIISDIPDNYKQLKLVVYVRSARSGAVNDTMNARVNNDSGTNYDTSGLESTGTVIAQKEWLTKDRWRFEDVMPAGSATANVFGVFELNLFNYAVTGNKRAGYFKGGNLGSTTSGLVRTLLNTISWKNTIDPINRIDLLSSFNFQVGTRYTLYGIR